LEKADLYGKLPASCEGVRMEAPEWRVGGGGKGARLAPDGVTEASGEGWSGRFERMTFGPGFHMNLARLEVTRDCEVPVEGRAPGPASVSLMTFLEGTAEVAMARGPTLTLKPGRAILFTAAGRRSTYSLPGPQTLRMFSVAMAPEVLLSLLDGRAPAALGPLAEGAGRETVVKDRPVDGPTRALLSGLGEPGEAGTLQRLQREALALRLVTEVIGAELTAETDSEALSVREAHALKAARAQLLVDLRETPSAAELAEAAGLGLRRFLRGFEAMHGASPAQLLRLERLEQARRMLEADELSLKEIAWRVGYSHANNFISAFSDQYGAPPRRFSRRSLAAE
jgi:AraC-like DNA-binding protein